MSDAARSLLTIEDWLAIESESPTKHELVGGELFAMAGAARRHNLLVGSFYAALRPAARAEGCRTYTSDMKLVIGENGYYPDVMVVCEPPEHDLLETKPCLLIEVRSPGTALTDRREKLVAYRTIPSLQAYVIADPDEQLVRVHRRRSGEWDVMVYGKGHTIDLPCPATTLDLDALYDGVE